MKHKYFLFLLILLPIGCLNAQVKNGGFEEWDKRSGSFPDNWIAFVATPDNCFNYISSIKKTNDSYSGDWALFIENNYSCNEVVYGGYIQTNDYAGFPLNRSYAVAQLPEKLEFYYKFYQEGLDSALVSVLLFHDDEEEPKFENRIDTLGYGSILIGDPTNSYTLSTIGINYRKMPEMGEEVYMYIFLTTSKGIVEGKNILNKDAWLGTKLWIDDIVAVGNVTSIVEQKNTGKPFFYPNPATEYVKIMGVNEAVLTFNVYNIIGERQTVKILSDNSFETKDYPKGTYLIQLTTVSGNSFNLRFIK